MFDYSKYLNYLGKNVYNNIAVCTVSLCLLVCSITAHVQTALQTTSDIQVLMLPLISGSVCALLNYE